MSTALLGSDRHITRELRYMPQAVSLYGLKRRLERNERRRAERAEQKLRPESKGERTLTDALAAALK